MKSFIIIILSMSFGLLAGNTAGADEWILDKAHSSVNFSVSHLVIARVNGTFGEFDVDFTGSASDFSDAVIETTIKTSSVNTGNEKRDGHLKADDFLNAELYPEIRFVSTGVEKTEDGRYRIIGDLTIRDITKQVVLDTKFNGVVKDPWGGTRAGFEASTTIDRFDFGVKWDSTTETGNFVAGKDVEITLLMEFVKKQQS